MDLNKPEQIRNQIVNRINQGYNGSDQIKRITIN